VTYPGEPSHQTCRNLFEAWCVGDVGFKVEPLSNFFLWPSGRAAWDTVTVFERSGLCYARIQSVGRPRHISRNARGRWDGRWSVVLGACRGTSTRYGGIFVASFHCVRGASALHNRSPAHRVKCRLVGDGDRFSRLVTDFQGTGLRAEVQVPLRSARTTWYVLCAVYVVGYPELCAG
jgi:hypothetical protein